MSVRFEKRPDGILEVFYENGVSLGQVFALEDGFYRIWFEGRGGCWDAHVLREIADKLDEMNRPWREEIDGYFADKD